MIGSIALGIGVALVVFLTISGLVMWAEHKCHGDGDGQ